MKLTFIGATHEVTGSCTFLEACGKNILIDFGMEQGVDTYENEKVPVSPSQIDYVLLTHAHIDHSGLLPLLFAGGFSGEIHATSATCSLCDIMLRDSAHIQMFEAEWRNRKGKRSGKEDFVPLYTMEDAVGAIELFRPHKYSQKVKLSDGIEICFVDAGHLLGSSSIEVWITENDITKKIVFSGDIGNINQPLIRDPQYISEADYVVMESTYGDRSHDARPDYIATLTEILQKTFDRGGSVIIPSFAVGRTQELLYFLRKIKTDDLVNGHDNFPVYVDSPLAVEATTIFNKNEEECFDDEALEYIRKGINPISFNDLILSVSSEDSKAINFDKRPKVIISASGMCEAGRIKHHLKHNLWQAENTILFVGYQAQNTLGRALLEGAKEVKIFGEDITVKAEIQKLSGISGHADVDGLLTWIKSFTAKPQRVFVVHGDSSVCEIFTARLCKEFGFDAVAPFSGTEYDLSENTCTLEAKPIFAQKKATHVSTAYARLLAAIERLKQLINNSSGRTNKDLAQLTDKINDLCDKW